MSKEHPVIVFYGGSRRLTLLDALAEMRGWYVEAAAEMLETLAFYTFYQPDIVILEDGADDITATYNHLCSIEAPTVLILTDTPELWSLLPDDQHALLPASAEIETVIQAIHDLTQQQLNVNPTTKITQM